MSVLKLSFIAEDGTLDARLEPEAGGGLWLWISESRQLEYATLCCGAQRNRHSDKSGWYCIKCQQDTTPPPSFTQSRDWEEALLEWGAEWFEDLDPLSETVLLNSIVSWLEEGYSVLQELSDEDTHDRDAEKLMWRKLADMTSGRNAEVQLFDGPTSSPTSPRSARAI